MLIGRQSQRAKHRERDMIGQFCTMLIFVRQQGAWALVGMQLSAIVGG